MEEDGLVPITLDLVHGPWRLRDFFLWNTSEDKLSVEAFAAMLCEDLKYPEAFEGAIASSIRSQLQLHNETLRKKRQLDTLRIDQEQRHLITLNLVINSNTKLCDQFEWDISEPTNSPEVFARHLATDLGLSREYEVSVAHSIRTQIEGFLSRPEQKLPSITDVFRSPNVRDDFAPRLVDL